jgi:hypothetical protein
MTRGIIMGRGRMRRGGGMRMMGWVMMSVSVGGRGILMGRGGMGVGMRALLGISV